MRARWTTLLPPEHGSWAFLALPAAVGLGRRPSLAGALLVLAVVCAFLIRVPLQRMDGPRRHPDAPHWVRILRPLGELSALLAMFLGSSHPVVIAGVGAALLAALTVRGIWAVRRSAAWELGGAGLFTLQAPAVLLLGGSPVREALLIWAFLILFTIPPLLYLRQRLDRNGGPGRISASLLAHSAALLMALAAFRLNWIPLAFVLWISILAARAAWGILRPKRLGMGARLGMLEALVGGVHLALLASWSGM